MKTKITGIIAVILAILLVRNVYAYQSYEGNFYEAEKIEGIYFYKHREDTSTEKYQYHNFHSQATIYRKSTDNNIVYCIESWEQISGSKANDHLIVNQKYPEEWEYLDAERVEALAYYGYGYHEDGYDHTDPKWYAITQYLIWETISPEIEHYFTSSITSSTPIYPFNKEIEELNTLVFSHTTKPLFENYVEKKNVIVNKPTLIKDTRGVLKNYDKIEADGLTVERISKDELLVTALKEGIHNMLLYQYYTRFNKPYTYYRSDKYQDMLEPGNIPTRRETVGFVATSNNEETEEFDSEEKNNETSDEKEEDNSSRPVIKPLEKPQESEDDSNKEVGNTTFEGDNKENDDSSKNETQNPTNEDQSTESKEADDENNSNLDNKTDESSNDKIDNEEKSNENENIPPLKEENNTFNDNKINTDNNLSNEEKTPENDSNSNPKEEIKKDEPTNSDISNSNKEEIKDTNEIMSLEKENYSDDTIKYLENNYEPIEVSVPATGASVLSIFFYALSVLGLLFIHNAS